MGWASSAIEALRRDQTVTLKPRGNSMKGRIEGGQTVTIEPVEPKSLKVEDIVLCKVHGREYLHLIKAMDGKRFQIGNNRGHINGWVAPNTIFGKVTEIG